MQEEYFMRKNRIKKVLGILLALAAILVLAAGLFLIFWPALGKNPSREQQAEYGERTDKR